MAELKKSVWNDGVPYLRHYTSDVEAQKAWYRLISYKTNLKSSNKPHKLENVELQSVWLPTNGYIVIPVQKNLYYLINFLTDFFTEPARLRAHRYNQPTAVDFWQAHGSAYVEQHPETSLKQRRDWLYMQTLEICNCRLTVAASILDFFKPTSLFEPCAGRGSIAFTAFSRKYIKHYEGCEPNTLCTQLIAKGLFQLRDWSPVKDVHEDDERTFRLHNMPIEDFLPSCTTKTYKMVWVCPPYFDLEVYAPDETQSIVRFPNLDVWYERWLLPTLRTLWQLVDEDGVLVLSINNAKDHSVKTESKDDPLPLRFNLTERCIQDLSASVEDAGGAYLGVISYQDGPRYEPAFVWKRAKKDV